LSVTCYRSVVFSGSLHQ